jgi:hypothetical protein
VLLALTFSIQASATPIVDATFSGMGDGAGVQSGTFSIVGGTVCAGSGGDLACPSSGTYAGTTTPGFFTVTFTDDSGFEIALADGTFVPITALEPGDDFWFSGDLEPLVAPPAGVPAGILFIEGHGTINSQDGDILSYTGTFVVTPEPASALLLAMGIGGLVASERARRYPTRRS